VCVCVCVCVLARARARAVLLISRFLICQRILFYIKSISACIIAIIFLMLWEDFVRVINWSFMADYSFFLLAYSFTRHDDDAEYRILITKACVISERAETNGYPCTCCTASYAKRK